jgi:hypothetical protein
MLRKENYSSHETIRSGLGLLQRKREYRVEKVVDQAHLTQRLNMLENPMLRFIHLTLSPRLPMRFLVARISSLDSPAPRVDALKLPSNPGSSGFDDELVMKPSFRNLGSTLWLVLVFGTIFFLTRFVPPQLVAQESVAQGGESATNSRGQFWGLIASRKIRGLALHKLFAMECSALFYNIQQLSCSDVDY